MLTPTLARRGLYRVLRIESISTSRNRPQNEQEYETRSASLQAREKELKELKKQISVNKRKLSFRFGFPINIGSPGADFLRHDMGLLNRESFDNDGKVFPHTMQSGGETDPEVEVLAQFRNHIVGLADARSLPPVKTYNENTVCTGERHDVYNWGWLGPRRMFTRSHPRVHIRVKPGQLGVCKYCVRQFILTDREGNLTPICDDRPPHYNRQHLFALTDDPARLPEHLQEDFKAKRGEWTEPHLDAIYHSDMYSLASLRQHRQASPFGEGPEHQPANYTRRLTHTVDVQHSFVQLPKRARDAPLESFVD